MIEDKKTPDNTKNLKGTNTKRTDPPSIIGSAKLNSNFKCNTHVG